MDMKNTTLDDVSSVIGFTATLRVSAWFGEEGNLYVPKKVDESQVLVALIGMSMATKLSAAWGGQHLAIPRPTQYDLDLRRRMIARMLEKGFTTRQVAHWLRLSERRVQQHLSELVAAKIIEKIVVEEVPVQIEQNVVRKTTWFPCAKNDSEK